MPYTLSESLLRKPKVVVDAARIHVHTLPLLSYCGGQATTRKGAAQFRGLQTVLHPQNLLDRPA